MIEKEGERKEKGRKQVTWWDDVSAFLFGHKITTMTKGKERLTQIL